MTENAHQRVLALDFDGVICDSAGEVFQTALETWSRIFPKSTLSDEIHQPDVRQAFEPLIPLGNRAEDFGVALHILSAGLKVETQDQYDRIRESLGTEWLDRFHHLFYVTRSRLRYDDTQRWLGFHKIYRTFIEVLKQHQKTTTLTIATAKDGESIRYLLSYFGIERLFREDLILDKETGVSKTLHLQAISDRLQCDPSQITFVDDKLNHLVKTAPLGVRGVLATWGHNTPREHQAAREAGFGVATLDTAEAVLFGS